METRQRLDLFFKGSPEREIVAAYLFGSVAAGRAHRESDVDVAVLFNRELLPDRADRSAAAEVLAGELMAVLRTNRIDLVPLNDAPPLFARAIITQGIRLFVNDVAVVHAFERDALLRAADLEPFMRRARARLLQVIGA